MVKRIFQIFVIHLKLFFFFYAPTTPFFLNFWGLLPLGALGNCLTRLREGLALVFKNMCFVIWKHVWKYVWVKKCMKIRVILFKNWKCVFEWVYQTPPKFWSCRAAHQVFFFRIYGKILFKKSNKSIQKQPC